MLLTCSQGIGFEFQVDLDCVSYWLFTFYNWYLQCITTDNNEHMNEVTGLHQPSDETDDSCRFQFIEIVPLDRDTDETRSAEWDGEDPSVDVTQEYCHDIKQEPKDVGYIA